jgi:gentisate 1,2-dioxygenase
MKITDEIRAQYRTAKQIREGGAIANLFCGANITVHGLDTRLLAWPGNGFQTQSVHVTTIQPGQQSDQYTYDIAEEAFLCRHGSAEVWLHDKWVTLQPGDIAYFPPGVKHQIRNPASNIEAAILVNQITPPQFDLYADKGFYNSALGVMNFDSIQKEINNTTPILPPANLKEMTFNDNQPDVRAHNLSSEQVRLKGALFNALMGTPFIGLGIPMRLVLWPGASTRMVGFNYANNPLGVTEKVHKHPVSDECLTLWSGTGELYIGGIGWLEAEANDVILAPCGVVHGHRAINGRGPMMMGGFASPPQIDLVTSTNLYKDGVYAHPQATELTDTLQSIPKQSADAH